MPPSVLRVRLADCLFEPVTKKAASRPKLRAAGDLASDYFDSGLQSRRETQGFHELSSGSVARRTRSDAEIGYTLITLIVSR